MKGVSKICSHKQLLIATMMVLLLSCMFRRLTTTHAFNLLSTSSSSSSSSSSLPSSKFIEKTKAGAIGRNSNSNRLSFLQSSTRILSTTDESATTTDSTVDTTSATATATATTLKQQITFTMDDIISLCKRRGIIFSSSEIYNGYSGFYDYGPLGVELKRSVKDTWWQYFVQSRDDVVGIDTSIIHNPQTWKSSGHVDGFSDPMVDCKETKLRYRADQLYYSPIKINDSNDIVGYVCVIEGTSEEMIKVASKQAKEMLKLNNITLAKDDKIQLFNFVEVSTITSEELMSQIPSPACNKLSLTMPREFNLMFTTQVGAAVDDSNTAYLRPETAQGIFLNYKNIQSTSRLKIPFGIAQIGKAFRNEITPRNFIFRSREFEQMEIEYFIPPLDSDWPLYYNEWINNSYNFLNSIIGLRTDKLGYEVHAGDKLAHYARACTDITFTFPFGTQELMGIAARGNYDLTQHSNGSGKSLDYYDEVTKEKYIPHCIEPSLGVDRLVLAIICSAYDEDEIGGEKRSVLRFNPRIAPIKVAVLPLVKNKEELVTVARTLYESIRKKYTASWDVSGAIGRRYRRADEVGTPFCITIDFDTIEKDNAVTIRDRDTTEQIRIPLSDVMTYLSNAIDG